MTSARSLPLGLALPPSRQLSEPKTSVRRSWRSRTGAGTEGSAKGSVRLRCRPTGMPCSAASEAARPVSRIRTIADAEVRTRSSNSSTTGSEVLGLAPKSSALTMSIDSPAARGSARSAPAPSSPDGVGDRRRLRATQRPVRLGVAGRDGREAIADAEVGVDVVPFRRGSRELGPKLAHEHVHGPVAPFHLPAPNLTVDLGPAYNAVLAFGQHQEDLELTHGEAHPASVGDDLDLIGTDLQVTVHDHGPRFIHQRGRGRPVRRVPLLIGAEQLAVHWRANASRGPCRDR